MFARELSLTERWWPTSRPKAGDAGDPGGSEQDSKRAPRAQKIRATAQQTHEHVGNECRECAFEWPDPHF